MPRVDAESYERLIPIEGTPVDMLNPPEGCPFAPRCEQCDEDLPAEDAAICRDGRKPSCSMLAACTGLSGMKQRKAALRQRIMKKRR